MLAVSLPVMISVLVVKTQALMTRMARAVTPTVKAEARVVRIPTVEVDQTAAVVLILAVKRADLVPTTVMNDPVQGLDHTTVMSDRNTLGVRPEVISLVPTDRAMKKALTLVVKDHGRMSVGKAAARMDPSRMSAGKVAARTAPSRMSAGKAAARTDPSRIDLAMRAHMSVERAPVPTKVGKAVIRARTAVERAVKLVPIEAGKGVEPAHPIEAVKVLMLVEKALVRIDRVRTRHLL